MKKLSSKIKITIVGGIFVVLAGLLSSPLLPYISDKAFFKSSNSADSTDHEKKNHNSLFPVRVVFSKLPPDINTVIKQLRTENNVRPLNQLETGRSILNTSDGTYFFVHASCFNIEEDLSDCLDKSIVRPLKQNESFFEVHYLTENEILLVAYVSEDMGAILAKANNNIKVQLIISPSAWGGFKHLALIPLGRIMKSSNREIVFDKVFDNDRTIHILDVILY